eukprot:CAMPEP_0198678094 /NCGR_PEP_ID=MMETSP1468-20131203/86_1 /TAXON_ID=1461545 /ORGANISM="Mantoniella sp, Strain CCMP1436" /LENGTH=33 /DNA_ID= /DNA_START= /DNA_END= /DNA_ORIENTATION=
MRHPATAAHAKWARVSRVDGRGAQCSSSPSVSA